MWSILTSWLPAVAAEAPPPTPPEAHHSIIDGEVLTAARARLRPVPTEVAVRPAESAREATIRELVDAVATHRQLLRPAPAPQTVARPVEANLQELMDAVAAHQQRAEARRAAAQIPVRHAPPSGESSVPRHEAAHHVPPSGESWRVDANSAQEAVPAGPTSHDLAQWAATVEESRRRRDEQVSPDEPDLLQLMQTVAAVRERMDARAGR